MNDEFTQDPNPERNQSQPPAQGGAPHQPPPGGYYAPQGPYPPYGPYGPPPRRARWWLIPVALGVGCLPWFILFIVFVAAIAGGGDGGAARGRHVALIRVSGVITAGKSGGFFSDNVVGSEDLVDQLEKARKNSDARVIVLRINSPGGSPSGSEEIYNEIQRVRESGKSIYTSMGDVAASGGYYIASASDKIYADANTLTGSIGVILPLADLSGLYKKIGYRSETVKAGKYKDMGSSDRPLTPEERALLQELVNDTYNNFTRAVAKGRNMTLDQVKKLAEGRIYSGNQAMKVKLVDEIGGLHETVRAAAKDVGISGEPKVVEYGRRGLFDAVFGGASENSQLKEAAARKLLEKLLSADSSGGKLR